MVSQKLSADFEAFSTGTSKVIESNFALILSNFDGTITAGPINIPRVNIKYIFLVNWQNDCR